MSSRLNCLLSFAMTLRGRLLVLICLATLPAALFTVYIAQNERSVALDHSVREAQYILHLLSKEHLYQLSGARGLLKWLAGTVASQKNDNHISDSNFLAALLSGYPQLGNIAILAANGDVLSSAYPLSGAVNMFKIDAIQRALHSSEIETGVYVVGPIVRRPLLHLAQSIRNSDGTVRYVIFVAIDLDWMKKLADKIELPSEQVLIIVDREGRVLANSSNPSNRCYPVGMLIPELSESVRLPGQSKVKSMIFLSSPIEDLPGVRIVSSVPYKHINDKANQTFSRMLASLSLLTLCTACSVVFLEEIALLRYLRSLSRASKRFGEGDYSARVSMPRAYGELHNMAEGFNTMAETLTHRHHELIEAHDQLDRLSKHLQIARESEAERIARDLHDEVGQVLTSIKLDLSSFQRQCRKENPSPAFEKIVEEHLSATLSKIDGLVEFVRQVASALRPPVLDRMGLAAAIELLARNLESKTELLIDLEMDKLDEPLDGHVSITIYRIVQEALTNIVRHAEAKLVNIRLRQSQDELQLLIEDDGKGIETCLEDGKSKNQSLGIIGMRERARSVNGKFSIGGKASRGTQISVIIPRNQRSL